MATTQDFSYPSSSEVTISGIGNPTGQAVPTDAVYIAGKDPSGNLHGVATDANGDLIVSPLTTSSTVTVVQPTGTNLHAVIDASALPAGASTSALQTSGNTSLSTIATNTTGVSTASNQVTGNASLSSIDTKTPALGQALAAASVPVVLTAAQVATLTPLTSVTVVQPTGTNLHTVVDSGSITVTQATGTNLHTVVDSSALPTGAATATNQATEISQLTSIASNTTTILAQQTNGTQTASAATPTAKTIHQAAISVGTTAVRLTVSGSTPNASRVVLVANPDSASTATFYIGSSTVTNSGASRGIQLVAGQSFIANNDAGDYYIISSTAAQTVEVMEQY